MQKCVNIFIAPHIENRFARLKKLVMTIKLRFLIKINQVFLKLSLLVMISALNLTMLVFLRTPGVPQPVHGHLGERKPLHQPEQEVQVPLHFHGGQKQVVVPDHGRVEKVARGLFLAAKVPFS